MKIIISHDIDHLTTWEHYRDLFLPKFYIRSLIEYFTGFINFSEFISRFGELFSNKLHNLVELMDFDKANKIPSTFFIAVEKGSGLSYSVKMAGIWAQNILNEGFELGLHGMHYHDLNKIVLEKTIFSDMTKLQDFGIRIHYLRTETNTLTYLNKSQYIYDSSIYKATKPYKIGNMWEFPIQIMDAYLIQNNGRQNKRLPEIVENTISIVNRYREEKLPYLNILFHDRYFSDKFQTWEEWYIWLIDWLKSEEYEFINFRDAIKELESQKNNKI